jgi:uncharacterized protein (DUF305 family)
MNHTWPSLLAAGLMLSLGGTLSNVAAQTGQVSARPSADSAVPRVNAADAHFMSGMIIHHEQAVLMAGWAPTHGASPSVGTLCERIAVSQQDEIALMERWLRDHGQPLPDTAWVFDYRGPAMAHAMLMAGMLTASQLAQLDSARGPEFDRLFLTGMIQHHRGALTMVEQLFNTPGAAQDNLVFQFASEINAGQTVEIDRMSRMLAALPAPPQH